MNKLVDIASDLLNQTDPRPQLRSCLAMGVLLFGIAVTVAAPVALIGSMIRIGLH